MTRIYCRLCKKRITFSRCSGRIMEEAEAIGYHKLSCHPKSTMPESERFTKTPNITVNEMKRTIIITTDEHDAMLNIIKHLEEQKQELIFLVETFCISSGHDKSKCRCQMTLKKCAEPLYKEKPK